VPRSKEPAYSVIEYRADTSSGEHIMKLTSSIATAILFTVSSSSVQAVIQYKITDLGTLGGTSSRAYSINNAGDIVGRSRGPTKPDGSNGARNAFLYTNGQMLNLGNFGGTNTIASASNSSRQVVGYSRINPDSS
jgi:probable HAF family extracellular repeat protein